MKVNKPTIKGERFYRMCIGSTFFVGDAVYMRLGHNECQYIECTECSTMNDIDDTGYYAVNLESGEVRQFEPNDCFEMCNCEVTILDVKV